MTTDKTPELVLIEWEDSAQPVSGWCWLNETTWGHIVICRSVGWLIHDTEDIKVLAPNLGDLDGELQACGVIRIPARSVTRVEPLSCRLARGHRA